MEAETLTHDEAALGARRSEVVAALGAVLPADMILARREDVTPYECDGLSAYRALPMVVVLQFALNRRFTFQAAPAAPLSETAQ